MNKIRLLLALFLCVFIAVLGIAFITVGTTIDEGDEMDKTEKTTTAAEKDTTTDKNNIADNTQAATQSTTAPTVTQPNNDEYEYAYAGFNPVLATVDSEKWNLLLVNQKYILPEDFTVHTSAVQGGGHSMDSRVVPYYNEMVNAAAKDGITLIPVSGYRSVERQRRNFERKIDYYMNLGYGKSEATQLAAKIVLMPSTSEHNAGLAMDFGTTGNTALEESFENTKAFQWLCENAADYGFILRYEKDTTEITMVTYEPWHWRYVGTKAAKEIKAKGITLEEYLGMA